MLRLLVAVFLVACAAPFSLAQPGGGTTPVPALNPDCGSVLATPLDDNPGFINCWISRNSTRAIAVHIFKEGEGANEKIKANFRQYTRGEESFESTYTQIENNGTVITPLNTAVINVTLVAVTHNQHPSMYKMVYTKDNTDYVIGHLNFVKGNKGRPASKVSVKLKVPKQGDMGIKVIPNSGDPCEEMPIEDIGEEEMIARSSANPNAPINYVAPIADCP